VNLTEANEKVNNLARAWTQNPTKQALFELKTAADIRDNIYFAGRSLKESRRWNR